MKGEFDKFLTWYRGIKSLSPDKMVVITCNKACIPSSRIVLLKKYDDSGFVFFTNFKSRKIREIEENNNVSLLFPDLSGSVIIQGKVIKTLYEEDDEYFATRGRKKQISAWSSKQSEELESEEILEDRVEFYTKKFMNKRIPRPDFWGGFRVVPSSLEFINNSS